ncbi:RAMP superfamily CRISPR-associated protein [Fusobacterium polymorphum]
MKIDYIVELILPAMTASLGTIGKDIDITLKRDSEGLPFFSAKHIKGILRSRVKQFKLKLEELGSEEVNHITINDFIKKYFGEEGNYLEEKNKFTQIRFSNLKLILDSSEKIQTGSRYGIRVNRKTKTVLPQSLFSYEFLVVNNKFEGSLELENCSDKQNEENFKKELKFILACLFHLEKIGGMKSRGIGKIKVKIKIDNDELEIEKNDINYIVEKLINKNNSTNINNNLENNLENFSYSLKLEEAIVLQEKKLGNYIKSRDSIQGSTIRGALIEYFHRKNYPLNILKNIESSDAMKLEKDDNKLIKEKVKLASLFEPKYDLKKKKKNEVKVDKVIETSSEIEDEDDNKNEIKLERASLSNLQISGNDISIKIDKRLKSVENGMLFNFEYISNINKNISQKFEGDLKSPKNLLKVGDKFTIYLGKYRSKGFGKATITIEKYNEDISTKEEIRDRIDLLTNKIKENLDIKIKLGKTKGIEEEIEKNYNKITICFDLQSDIILPYTDIYDAGKQFLIIAGLNKIGLDFNTIRSFINVGKLEGYNIINNVRKMDELIFSKGSVFTYNIDNCTDELLAKLVKIEKDGLGLRKNEGFGKIKICTIREGF